MQPRLIEFAGACSGLRQSRIRSGRDSRTNAAASKRARDVVALTFARPVAPSNFNRKIVYPPSGLATIIAPEGYAICYVRIAM